MKEFTYAGADCRDINDATKALAVLTLESTLHLMYETQPPASMDTINSTLADYHASVEELEGKLRKSCQAGEADELLAKLQDYADYLADTRVGADWKPDRDRIARDIADRILGIAEGITGYPIEDIPRYVELVAPAKG